MFALSRRRRNGIFGTERIQALTRKEIDDRFILFRELTHLD